MAIKYTEDGLPILPSYAHRKIQKAVREAAVVLDKTEPNWAHHVRLNQLVMSDPNSCILGWAFRRKRNTHGSGYMYAVDKVAEIERISNRNIDPFGSEMPADNLLSDRDKETLAESEDGYYNGLAQLDDQADSVWMEAWAHEVKNRRAKTRSKTHGAA